jgi:hypothetical protein
VNAVIGSIEQHMIQRHVDGDTEHARGVEK